jgi:hypothetical protein
MLRLLPRREGPYLALSGAEMPRHISVNPCRFNGRVSNGEIFEVTEIAGVPEEIRTPDPQIPG